ncbi:TonB-dependent hemoglobin/transferrin/lactoferrin family receptor [Janthinobacterium fluminis]|uniref:TonB-dependent hemoglobin/transferrin/lactoferrin family receptor n=1 Tax=Janthinobacterium fluminis TaxID=2987524 RepID=A0ABT5JVQ8_9BURK|nr:TonB-dependent hemoglobin/transferrin/lactoferrin family receptor [Janthinobacterium fluminis]MDC8756815.1 TonB-dependent hemoglobin/transferrin/lactoferrin family receptor [Janthinobacterium fluminis]
MSTLHLRPSAAPFHFHQVNHAAAPAPRLLNLAVRAALLGLFATPMLPLPAHAQAAEAAVDAKRQAVFPEVLVKATQERVRAGSKTVIGADELSRRGATDMGSIMRYEPLIGAPLEASGAGAIWDGSGNTGYNIRGVEGNRVSLDVDGIALPDAAPKPDANSMNSFGVGRDYFDPETFREVRVNSGTSAAGAGAPGLGGGVSFVTKSPDDYLVEGKDSYVGYKFGRTSIDGADAHTLTGAARFGQLRALALFVHRKGHERGSKGDAPRNPDNWKSDAVLSKWLWDLAAGQKLDLTIDAFKRKNARAFNNKQGASYPEGAQQNSTTKRSRVSLGHYWTAVGVPLFDTLSSRVYVQDAKVDDLTHARYITGKQPYLRDIATSYNNKSYGIGADAVKQVGAAHTLAYGVSLEQTETTRPWREDRTVLATGAHQITPKNRMADMDTTRVLLHLRDDFSFDLAGHKATLTPGLRAEYRKMKPKNLDKYAIAVPNAAKEVKEESDTALTPSVGLSVEVAPGLDAYAQYSRGTRLPTAAERTGTYDSFSYTGSVQGYAVLGNRNLSKETSNAFEIGLKGAPAKGLTFSGALFYTTYNNLIDYALQPDDPVNYPTITRGLYRAQNIGKVRTWGGEVSGRMELGAWAPAMLGFHVDLAAGLTRGSSEDTTTGVRETLASAAPYKASFTFGYEHHPSQLFGADLIVTRAGGKQAPVSVASGFETAHFAVPAYTLVDLSAYWNISKNAKLTLGVFNLGDRKYWDYASSRSLAPDTGPVSHADIERQALAGRNVAVSLSVNY